ncbi:MAG: hypothetical protein ACI8XB_002324 [Patiriisocius sp.]|jgi:hypothetical protein
MNRVQKMFFLVFLIMSSSCSQNESFVYSAPKDGEFLVICNYSRIISLGAKPTFKEEKNRYYLLNFEGEDVVSWKAVIPGENKDGVVEFEDILEYQFSINNQGTLGSIVNWPDIEEKNIEIADKYMGFLNGSMEQALLDSATEAIEEFNSRENILRRIPMEIYLFHSYYGLELNLKGRDLQMANVYSHDSTITNFEIRSIDSNLISTFQINSCELQELDSFPFNLMSDFPEFELLNDNSGIIIDSIYTDFDKDLLVPSLCNFRRTFLSENLNGREELIIELKFVDDTE